MRLVSRMYMHGRFDAILLKPAQVQCTGNRTHDPQLVRSPLHGHICTEWSPKPRTLPPSSPSRPRIARWPRPESRAWPFMRPIHFPDFALHLCGPACMSYVDKCVFSRQAQLCSKIVPLPLHAKPVNSTRCVVITRRLVRVGYGLLPRSQVPVVSTRTRTSPTGSWGDSSRLHL